MAKSGRTWKDAIERPAARVRIHKLPFWLSRHRMFIGTILALTAPNAINIRPLWGQLYAYPLITKFHLKNYTFFLCP